ncbi:MAG TPA: trehalose-phosphatase [Sandaracinaceae bacterium LLY-WYZ-13_1]|nr:trehalose-phosphatase [Sandaracinaceae bacterium LLY-WYZ-13_1]
MSPRHEVDPGKLAEAIAALERPLVIALDVDGTLAPIVEDPSKARVPSATARTLRHLRSVDGVELALVTGRDHGQLERMVSLPGAWRVVEHGRVIIAPGERPRGPSIEPEDRRRLGQFRAWALEHAGPRGAHVEDKDAAVVVHVRKLAAEDRDAAEAVLDDARDAATELDLCCRDGRAVLEAELEPSDKGTALASLLDAAGAASCVYAGDDLTDEPAIALASRHGIGIFVRSAERPDPPPGTTAVVEGPGGLAELLGVLERTLKPAP